MKFFQQEGTRLERTQLQDSDNICDCCADFKHGAESYHHDDVECTKCHSLCCCGCHRES